MPFNPKRIGFALLASVALVAQASAQTPRPAQPAPAPAQSQPAQQAAPQGQQPQGPMKVDLSPSQAEWTKVCGKDQAANKEVCYTTRDFGTQPDQPPVLAIAVYDVKGEDQKIVRFLMPIGLMLRPGFRFSVDKGATLEGGFEVCFPNGCFAEAKVKTPTIDAMKKGQVINVSVKNQVNNEVTFTIPIAGFGKSFDGPAIDPKVLEDQQKKLQDELQKRAEDERKKEDDRKKAEAMKGGAALTPAPAAPKQ